jgi:hypothetical protein
MLSWHIFAQCWILVFSSAAAYWTSSGQSEVRRAGYVAALISQPAYFYATITADQFGNVIMACLYTVMFIRGLHNNWR